MPVAPAASCALGSGRTHTSNNEYPGITRRPRTQWFLTVSFALLVIGLFCHHRPRTNVLSAPGRADITSANLTPASGRQDHTTSPYAATSLVRSLLIAHGPKPALQSRRAQNAAASTAFHPAFRDDHDTPLSWGGMARVLELIWGKWEQKYFSENPKSNLTALETAWSGNLH